MTLNIPDSEQEVIDSVRNDVQQALPESNPFLADSFLNALLVGYSGAVFDFYRQLDILIQEIFPDTATEEFLERWGSFVRVTRNPAIAASGNVIFTGTDTTVIPLGTGLQSSDSIAYTTTQEATIADQSVGISSLTRSGSLVTAVFASAHNLGSGISVTISGANETEYNGTFTITATSATEVTYTIATTPSTPATGTILAAYTIAVAPVEADTEGLNTNQANGAQLNLTSAIPGANSSAIVTFDGLSGGTDLESDEDFRTRVLDRWQNPVANFNSAQINNKAKEVSGVTRVFIKEITPNVGQVTIYFTRDDDDNIIPDAGEVQDVKDSILTIKPGHTSDDDVIVLAPTPKSTDFTFNTIDPNTATMKDAIIKNLEQFFTERTDVGVTITADSYRAAIFNSLDVETGARLESFDLQAPVGNIFIADGELGTLGTVSFL